MKMFISYTHADSLYLELFKKHLVTLERNKLLSTWCDQEIIAGDKLDDTIKINIENADIVVFLISVDFLNSFYCYEKELVAVINNLENYKQKIVPIIVRDCDWHDGAIDNYKCITVSDKPVSSHPNSDTAWLSVIKDIKKLLESIKDRNSLLLEDKKFCLKFKGEFSDHLESTCMQFHHRIHGKLKLSDIYIYPQIKKISEDIDKINFPIDSEQIFKKENIAEKTIVIGDEQVGKTSLAKMLIKKFQSENILPLYFEGDKIKKSEIDKVVSKLINDQYELNGSDEFFAYDCMKLAVVDNFHNIQLNEKAQHIFIENILRKFDKIIIFADNITRYSDSEYIKLSDFNKFELLTFGHKLKSQLIDKWNSLGQEDTLDIRELHTKNNITTQHLDSIVRKNILDSKPIYLLIVLQAIDSSRTNDYSLTSYGHCYQYLITQNFEKSNIGASELDTFFNYLTELSFFMYMRKGSSITRSELKEFQTEYSNKYFVKSHDNTISKLIETGIISNKDINYSFGYVYIYYFYIAKYLSDHINDKEICSIIETLCDNLHIEKNANILIFLTHHSKNESIIDNIFLHVSEIYSNVSAAKLDKSDTDYLQDFMDLIPEKVYEQRDVSKEREKYLDDKDRIEEINGGKHKKNNDDEKEDDNLSKNNYILNIIKSIKSIELIGQILRNRYGSLTKTQLIDLGIAAIDVGLKLLKYHLTLTESFQNEVISYIEKMINSSGRIKNESVIKDARKIYLALNYGIAYSVVVRIAKSIGSEAIITLFDELGKKYNNSPAFNIMAIAVKLDFTTKIPKKEIESLLEDLKSIPITKRLLRDIIIQHAHLHHTDYKDKQWINNVIKIPINSQIVIGLQSHKQ